LHRGVYQVGAITPHSHEIAALLACGTNAALSHRSAAALWKLLPYPASAPVDITLPPARSTKRSGLRIHRAVLDPRDVRRRESMTATSPPRTLLDLAAGIDLETLERVVAEANYRRLASDEELRVQLERYPRRHGAARLRRLLDLPGGPRRTRSGGERRLLRGLRDAGIDGFEVNGSVHGYEVDFLWRDLKFGVELDGWDGHSGRLAFERDRLKMSELEASGLTIMPITGRQVRSDLPGVLDRLGRALARRSKG
jgi:very-short-patch-repair endonuclease